MKKKLGLEFGGLTPFYGKHYVEIWVDDSINYILSNHGVKKRNFKSIKYKYDPV